MQKFTASRNTIILGNFRKKKRCNEQTKRFLSTYENWWGFRETCHASYTKQYTYSKKLNDLALYDNAFINFDNEYFNPLIKSGRAVNIRTLLQKYQEQLLIDGISKSDAENYRAEKLKKSLTCKYGSSLIFASQKNPAEPQIVYSSHIDIVDVINTAYSYQKI